MTNPNPHGQVPAIQRYSIGYHSDEWGVRSLSPIGIYDDAGPWVRYEDHAAELCRLHAYCQELEAQVIRDCMTHVQNPPSSAVLKAIREANMQLVRTGDDAFMLVPYKVATAQAAESVPAGPRRKDMLWSTAKMQERHDQRIENIVSGLERIKQEHAGQQPQKIDECYGDCPTDSTTCTNPCRFDGRAARDPAESVLEDAALWHWLAEYLVGTRTDLDDEIVASETVNDLRKLVEAARKQGGIHD